jgi:anti-sigma regulatory factor (Ser/Thr protein kinase)
MTANHRTWAGRRHTAEEPLPLSTPTPLRPAGPVHEPPAPRDGATLDWRITVPGVPALVTVARRLVRSALDGCPRRDDVELVTSELVTNAIRHTPSGAAGSVVTLRIRAAAGRARVEVTDQGDPSWTAPPSAGDDDEYGRGLTLVHLLADRAGHEPAPGGQVCWAEIRWDAPRDPGSVRAGTRPV